MLDWIKRGIFGRDLSKVSQVRWQTPTEPDADGVVLDETNAMAPQTCEVK